MSTDINRIAELAKEDPKRQFSSIAHLITGEKLYEAFRSLRKNASAGIDGVTYQQYETNAEENIRQLHQRLKEGKYRAQPLRRVYIPKEDGKQRPISIPALEDKIVQKVAVDLLSAIYEQDFLDCSYGFRAGQGQPISPLLANVYLHHVLDKWFEDEVKPRLKGEAYEIRFADDAILCFQQKEDAEKVLAVLPKRFEKYGLTLHPEKTRLIEFGRYAAKNAKKQGKKP